MIDKHPALLGWTVVKCRFFTGLAENEDNSTHGIHFSVGELKRTDRKNFVFSLHEAALKG